MAAGPDKSLAVGGVLVAIAQSSSTSIREGDDDDAPEERHQGRRGEQTLGELGTVVGHESVDEVVSGGGCECTSVELGRAFCENDALNATPANAGLK